MKKTVFSLTEVAAVAALMSVVVFTACDNPSGGNETIKPAQELAVTVEPANGVSYLDGHKIDFSAAGAIAWSITPDAGSAFQTNGGEAVFQPAASSLAGYTELLAGGDHVAYTVSAEGANGARSRPVSVKIYKDAQSYNTAQPPAAQITGITIEGANSVEKGGSAQYTAKVEGSNLEAGDKAVFWSVSGGSATISANGLLAIPAGETAGTLTVQAVSQIDDSYFDTKQIIVVAAGTPTLTRFDLSALDGAEVLRGGSLSLSADIAVSNGGTQAVSWEITGGKNADGSPIADFTAESFIMDDNPALLTDTQDESAVYLTITATAAVDGTTKSVDVFVRRYNILSFIGDEFGGWGDSTPPDFNEQNELDYEGLGKFKKTGLFMTKGATFKFRDNTTTTWDAGNWVVPGTFDGDTATTTGERYAGYAAASGENSWTVTTGGCYDIVVDTAHEKIHFTLTPQTLAPLTNVPQGLAPGETWTLSTSGTLAGAPAISWSVSGGNSANNATAIATNGALTLDAGEWIGHTLTVSAESLGEKVEANIPVIDANLYMVGSMNGWSNNWSSEIDSMTRGSAAADRATFTWTGDIGESKDFRLTNKNKAELTGWSRDWIVPNHNENNAYWINDNGGGSGTERISSGTTEKKWFFNYSRTPGDVFTIVYNAAAKTLTITKQ